MALTTTESEMVLLAMLPDDDRVMLVQTPRLRTIADLEDFIVDEYARVFPHLPKLNRDLRIQKCVSPELVVDRRAHAKVRQQAPHCFVDLAKNVQAGNVFKNMEQIYVVINSVKKQKRQSVKKIAAEPQNLSPKNGADLHKNMLKENHDIKKKTAAKDNHADKKKVAEKHNVKAKTSENHDSKTKAATKGKQETMKKVAAKENQESQKKAAAKKNQDAKTKPATKENHDAKEKSTKDENHEAKTKAAVKETHDAKKMNSEKDQPASKKPLDVSDTIDAPKKTPFQKKSGNVLLKKMLAAKHDGAESGAAQIVKTLPTVESDAAKKNKQTNGKVRKASEKDSADAGNDVGQPPAKKAKASPQPSAADSGAKTQTTKTAKKNTAAKLEAKNDKSTTSTKSETTAKSKLTTKKVAAKSAKSDDFSNSGRGSEPTSITTSSRKLKKKMDIETNEVENPAAKRAKTGTIPKETTAKKVTEQAETVATSPETSETPAPTTANAETISKSSSNSSSTASPQADETASEDTEVAKSGEQSKRTARKNKQKAHKVKVSLSETPASKTSNGKSGGFRQILEATSKRLAAEKEAEAERVASMAAEHEKANAKQKSKTPVETASESSDSDSDAPAASNPVVAVAPPRKQPVKSSSDSSSSSDEEELDYSQSLLADLTKNDSDEDEAAQSSNEKHKKVDDDGVIETSQDSDMPSSELTQKSQESASSVLLPSLSRSRFSLGSMPVAKLKKSSKNPFSSKNTFSSSSASPKKTKAKTGTSRPRGRPHKVKE